MVWRRSLARLADRADVAPSLKKWWKKHYKVDGMVSQHLSPFEQKIVSPMMKDLPVKFLHRTVDFVFEAGPGLAFGFLLYWWGEKKHKEIAYHHRV